MGGQDDLVGRYPRQGGVGSAGPSSWRLFQPRLEISLIFMDSAIYTPSYMYYRSCNLKKKEIISEISPVCTKSGPPYQSGVLAHPRCTSALGEPARINYSPPNPRTTQNLPSHLPASHPATHARKPPMPPQWRRKVRLRPLFRPRIPFHEAPSASGLTSPARKIPRRNRPAALAGHDGLLLLLQPAPDLEAHEPAQVRPDRCVSLGPPSPQILLAPLAEPASFEDPLSPTNRR